MFDEEAEHWYLLLVDMVRRELVCLDSKPCKVQRRLRERQIRRVGVFLEEMLEDKSFYKRQDFPIPHVSAFQIVTPKNLQEQANGYEQINPIITCYTTCFHNHSCVFIVSVDCGVWVCMWMTLADQWGTYNLGVSKKGSTVATSS